jgi:hypothetical protein
MLIVWHCEVVGRAQRLQQQPCSRNSTAAHTQNNLLATALGLAGDSIGKSLSVLTVWHCEVVGGAQRLPPVACEVVTASIPESCQIRRRTCNQQREIEVQGSIQRMFPANICTLEGTNTCRSM